MFPFKTMIIFYFSFTKKYQQNFNFIRVFSSEAVTSWNYACSEISHLKDSVEYGDNTEHYLLLKVED